MENKTCPFCGETIRATAKKCRYCDEWLDTDAENITTAETSAVEIAQASPAKEITAETYNATSNDSSIPSKQLKTYNVKLIRTLVYLGIIGACLSFLEFDNKILWGFKNDVGYNTVNTLIIIGNVLQSAVMCVFLYCTMIKFEIEGTTSPSKGIFTVAIIFEALTTILVIATDNLEKVSESTVVIWLIAYIASLTMLVALGIGFCNSKNVSLGVVLIVLPLIDILICFFADDIFSAATTKVSFKLIMVAYVCIQALPYFRFTSLLTGDKASDN